jgi:hypothetical protein
MLSGSSLLNGNTSKVIQNPNTDQPLYNPNIPVKGASTNYDKFTKPSHNVKLKSQYYKQMLLGDNIKNGGTYSLGSNSKGLNIFQDYDRAIDPNMMRRRNPDNNKQTIANDYQTGSYDAYYSIPITTKPVVKIDVGADPLIKKLNQQTQYKNRFDPTPTTKDNAGYAMPIPINNEVPINMSKIIPQSNVNDLAGIGTDPTEDPEYIRLKNEMLNDREQSELNRNTRLNEKTTNLLNKYGKPRIRSGTVREPIPIRRPLNIPPL